MNNEKARAARKPRAKDLDIAWHIWRARLMARLTMAGLAEKIGITYQQLHRYELGVNRIPASRLMDVARATKQPIESFFLPVPEGAEERRAA